MTTAGRPVLLQVFSTFAVGGPQLRFAAVANRFPTAYRHVVIATDSRLDARRHLDAGLDVDFRSFPRDPAGALRTIARIRGFLRDLRPDLLVTSNWGSMDWVLANRLFAGLPHLHSEDGFGPDEADGQKTRRVLARRMLLRRSRVVLPSMTLLGIARDIWRLPEASLRYVPNGVDLARFTPDGPPAAIDLPGEGPVIGTVATLRAEKNIARLIAAVARLRAQGRRYRLVVVGDGPERTRLQAEAAARGLGDAVLFTGPAADPSPFYRVFDIFALSSDTEQMPLSVLEAMASGLPVVATDVGDVRAMLSAENAARVVAKDEAALAAGLDALLADAGLRSALGRANRARTGRDFDQETMFAAWAALYDEGIAAGKRRGATA